MSGHEEARTVRKSGRTAAEMAGALLGQNLNDDPLTWECSRHGRVACACWRAAIDAEIARLNAAAGRSR